ncbi:deoxyhypusine hydroxylase [Bacillus rossius redtenbacheri]|uniref:deoxyhypusine hydroxylase n=1 Tax=Bacillus rossius redtenbacheri TaxID=93214 RepID=UPI002FDD2DE2
MCGFSVEKIKAIGKVLNNPNRPLKERFRALFTLKNIGGDASIECIRQCFNDSSVLLKHELAYCLGQMQDKSAVPILKSVLENREQEPMVRHEAAEALGAIGSPDLLGFLEAFLDDPVVEVKETCQLAAERLRWLADPGRSSERLSLNPYSSVDPAPPAVEADVGALKAVLLDNGKPLFERYRAMFALRNLHTEASVLALAEGLCTGSALFRHEVAFVLGQLQSAASVPHLVRTLEDRSENEMVRHEAAEALGAVASPECLEVLGRYLRDEARVVRESCEVALDMCEYENSLEFQYADTLVQMAC